MKNDRASETTAKFIVNDKWKKLLQMFGTILAVVMALVGALSNAGRIRFVDILLLFVGGFGAGAGMMNMIAKLRHRKKR